MPSRLIGQQQCPHLPVVLATASAFEPQVALLDIRLPVMIAITGYSHEGDRQKSDQAGFSDHLKNPVATWTLFSPLDALGSMCTEATAGGH